MADFRAVYHLGWSDALRLPAPEFFALAVRLPVFPGVIRMRAMEEEHAANRNVRPGSKMVESTPERIESDALLSGLIEFA